MGSEEISAGTTPEFFGGLDVFGDSTPVHDVTLKPYCMDVYEVSIERYESCVQEGACDPGEGECSLRPSEKIYRTRINHLPDECQNHGELCPHYPANCRSYEQAFAYCRWIGRRLCTEAEWERAAGGPGPERRKYPWGDEPASRKRSNTCIDGPGHLAPVEAFPEGVSAEGVYNLSGNVYEWVHDYYAPYQAPDRGPLVDPRGPDDGFLRVGRGGCFLSESGFATTERTTFNPAFDWG
jgi:formylglycine-generating enzyme required for sulfatase activity